MEIRRQFRIIRTFKVVRRFYSQLWKTKGRLLTFVELSKPWYRPPSPGIVAMDPFYGPLDPISMNVIPIVGGPEFGNAIAHCDEIAGHIFSLDPVVIMKPVPVDIKVELHVHTDKLDAARRIQLAETEIARWYSDDKVNKDSG